MIKIKRVYEKATPSDGLRILIDRLWPRGISKKEAQIDLWLKGIAPSEELRKWFRHDPQKWSEFQKRYFNELEGKKELVRKIKELEKEHHTVTLLYGAKNAEHNNAIALLHFLEKYK
jgi:uncharacterized protein YeaO (DUF488 family)